MHITGLNIMSATKDQWHIADSMVIGRLVVPIDDHLKTYGFDLWEEFSWTFFDDRWDIWEFRCQAADIAVVITWPHSSPWISVWLANADDDDQTTVPSYVCRLGERVLAELPVFDTAQVYPCPREWLSAQLEKRGFCRLA